MAHTIWKGTIAFGLLTVPVKVSVAARQGGTGFNLLHKKCGERISQYRWCDRCDHVLEPEDIRRGHEEPDGSYLAVEDKDLRDCAPESSRVMEITSVANLSEIDPLLFETSYYLEPEDAGRKGFKLLLLALAKERKVAVATVTMHQREHVVVIRPMKGQLVFHTMFFADEVREAPETVTDLADVDVNARELDLAIQLLKVNEKKFAHAEYTDGYQERVEKMLQAKRRGRTLKPVKLAAVPAPAPDILAVLKASIARKKKVA
jgi:DNA end-binding protein Ku